MFAGWIANIILGGSSRPADWGELIIAGLVGSFVGGLLFSLIAGDGVRLRPSGIIGSIIGAVVVLAVTRAVRSRTASKGTNSSKGTTRSKR